MIDFQGLAAQLLSLDDGQLGVGVSDEAIAAAEQELQLRIEGGYRQFLSQFGWGGVRHLLVYGLGGPRYMDVVHMTKRERTELEPALALYLLPVMNDGGGNLYCLDTRVSPEPTIVYWSHGGGRDQVPEVEAESFGSWLWKKLKDLED